MEKESDNKTINKKGPKEGNLKFEAKLSYKIIMLILEYRDSKIFKWISNHQGISMGFIFLYGMLILILLLWFIFSRIPS